MFIPTKSGGQIFVNLRMNLREKKNKKQFYLLHAILPFAFFSMLFDLVFFFLVGPTCPFIPLFGPFQPRNNLFCPGLNFLYPN